MSDIRIAITGGTPSEHATVSALVADALKLWTESAHPRSDDGKFGTGSGGHAIGQTIEAALSKQNLSAAKKGEYSDTARAAMAGMSHSTLRKLGENVKAVKFYENGQALDEHLSTALDDPDGTFGGGFDADKGVLHLNGGSDSQGIYAHAMAHALDSDGEGGRISDGAAWQAAWSAEIVDRKAISSHASSDASDGFAEFARVLHGGYQSDAETKREFPKCYDVWIKAGLK